MIDPIIVSKSEFLSRKDGLVISDDIKQKYEDMFKSFDCFHNVNYLFLNTKHKHTSAKFKTHSKPSPPSFLRRNDNFEKSYVKRVKGILNTINNTNYDKLKNKLFFLLQEDNINIIIEQLIDVAVLQVFYIDIFIRLIADLLKTNLYNNIIVQELDRFIEKYYTLKFIKNEDRPKYEQFCIEQKYKQDMISKAILILHVIKNGYCSHNVESFMDYIENKCHTIIKNNNIIEIDIVLQTFIQAKKILEYKICLDRCLFNDLNNNMKLRFLIEEIYKKE